MDNIKKKAKQNVLEDLRNKAKSMMGSKLSGVKKSEDKSGDDALAGLKEVSNDGVTEVESVDAESDECEGMSVEEINEKIKSLMAYRDKMPK